MGVFRQIRKTENTISRQQAQKPFRRFWLRILDEYC